MTTENTALTTKPNAVLGVNLRELNDVAALIFNSKVYGDIQTKEAAAIKVIAGMEYGFTPFQSMSMFDFIQGRPTLNAHGKATLINSSGDFRLKINELTNFNCSISVVRKSDEGMWKVVNTETFSWDDAKQAELTTGKNAHSWKKYPRNMLFARCVSNIWRWDTAELNMRKLIPGQINEFEAEELQEESGATTNGNVVEGEIVEDKPDFVEPDILESPDDVDVTDFVEADESDADPEPIDTKKSKRIDYLSGIEEADPERVAIILDGRELAKLTDSQIKDIYLEVTK